MKRWLLVAAGALALSSVALAFDDAKDFNTYMKGMVSKVKRAFETKNPGFFASISTPDFTETMGGRTSSKKESMEGMKSAFKDAKSIKANLKLDSTKIVGGMGIAMTSGHFVMVMKPTKADPKSHVLTMDMWQKETWVRSGKAWKIKKIEETKPMKMTMDGKPFDPSSFSPSGGGK